jgi:hypothetical protein
LLVNVTISTVPSKSRETAPVFNSKLAEGWVEFTITDVRFTPLITISARLFDVTDKSVCVVKTSRFVIGTAVKSKTYYVTSGECYICRCTC